MSKLKNRNGNRSLNRREFVTTMAASAVALVSRAADAFPATENGRKAYLVPNFHPSSCGWLTTFSRERVYCANSYLDHLDRVRDDPNYAFVISEVNNIVAIMEFHPERIQELKQRINQGRVEVVNAFFLESTVNLSGGEALARLGVEGLRWYEQVLGVRPRYSWIIDVCGVHDQMAQISVGLGLEAMIYTRGNPTDKTMYWAVSPDGTKILSVATGGYAQARPIFTTKAALTKDDLEKFNTFFTTKEKDVPKGAPLLVLTGSGDYSLSPTLKSYPSEFLKQWKKAGMGWEIKFTTLSRYMDAIVPGIQSGAIDIPTYIGGTAYHFDSFWIENNNVKVSYRRNEHALQTAEALATIASLHMQHEYPVKDLHESWILMCLNMDRNTLWGAAAGAVFVSPASWDVQDRFTWVRKTTDQVIESAGEAALAHGDGVGLFNSLNWRRQDVTTLQLPVGSSVEGAACEALPDGSALCKVDLPGVGLGGWKLARKAPETPQTVDLPQVITTKHYAAHIDPTTGALTSLKLNRSGRELLAHPANVIVAEHPIQKLDDPADHMPPRPGRKAVGTSSDQPSKIKVTKGPVATTVQATGTFYGGGAITRTTRFYHDSPRIDFETELNDVPDGTIVVAEFPLATDISEVRRGIPFGFSHGAWATPNPRLHGWTKGIVPAVRWSDYYFSGGGGFAILDRGLTGRELNERTPIIYLLNAQDMYHGLPNEWLSGKGRNVMQYAVLAYDGDWKDARIPQTAWEYNVGPVVIPNRRVTPPQSFLETSNNVIVEAMRREDDHIEVRLVESQGIAGTAMVKLLLPHRKAMLTNLAGNNPTVLPAGSAYTFNVKPQQIITLHFETSGALLTPDPITTWDPFVSSNKVAALHHYEDDLKGHPPFGDNTSF